MRLQAIDAEFYAKYEKYASDPEAAARGLVKDYFEPGVPPEMVRKSSRSVLGTHSISPTPPAVGYTSNNFSSVSSIESARPATIDEGPDSVFTEDSCLTDELKTGINTKRQIILFPIYFPLHIIEAYILIFIFRLCKA